MYPLPAVAGQSLSLRCLVWGTNKIIKLVFYKNNSHFQTVERSQTYRIKHTTESEVGLYKCVATYRYADQTVPNPHEDTCDPQEVSVHGRSHHPLTAPLQEVSVTRLMPRPSSAFTPMSVSPVRAELSEGMYCSCSSCDSGVSYRCYKRTADSWSMLSPNKTPDSSGTYRCRAVKDYMRTLPSRSLDCE